MSERKFFSELHKTVIVVQLLSCGLASTGDSFEDLGAPCTFSPGANLSAIVSDSHSWFYEYSYSYTESDTNFSNDGYCVEYLFLSLRRWQQEDDCP